MRRELVRSCWLESEQVTNMPKHVTQNLAQSVPQTFTSGSPFRPKLENIIGMRPAGGELSETSILIESLRDSQGNFDLKKADAISRDLSRQLRVVKHKRELHEAMLHALDRLLKGMTGADLKPHSPVDPILDLKKKVRAEHFVALQKFDGDPPVKQFLTSHWFDFRMLPTARADDMIKFGKELAEQGLVRLPFDNCVFVFSYVNSGGPMSSACLLRQDGGTMVAYGVVNYLPQGRPVGIYGEDKPIDDAIFFALAVLSSKSVSSVRRSVATGEIAPNLYKGDVYSEVCINNRGESGNSGRGHASPRLHWRRGHIRHLIEKTTWVRPTLVGASDNGVVVHDYVSNRTA